ncbi:helix-turn-helix domain-containing protein [Sphingobacterium detergens]|uniref:DNA-binding XRE family transcriptional regulator n=1 Tax=Sphingobacterium detergens TaxID=1145106 RepID=A0A420BFF4_SPHD1|nr:helix-turn-helix domain-containing protein [Sphingobacterium detergens]RKE55430.1 DNA-binding XRE family transcriptional regulator [Sphingobacterium detergens]
MKKNLKQIRNEKILSQQELANLSGISLRTIQRIEKNESKGSPYIIKSLCKALDIDPQTIYFESDDLDENTPEQPQGTTALEPINKMKRNDCQKEIKYINFSALIVLLVPFANLISVPVFYFLFKKKLDTNASTRTALKILSFQIIWSIATMLFMISTPLVILWFSSIPAIMLDIPMFVWVYWFMLFIHLITTFFISFQLNKKDHPVQFIPNLL